MAPAALAFGGLPEFPMYQIRFGFQFHLQSQMLRKLRDSFLSGAAGDTFGWGNGSLFRLCVQGSSLAEKRQYR